MFFLEECLTEVQRLLSSAAESLAAALPTISPSQARNAGYPPPSGYRVFQFGIYVVKDLMTLPPRCQNKCENYGMKIWEVSSLGTLNNQSCVNIFFRKFEILLLGSYRSLSSAGTSYSSPVQSFIYLLLHEYMTYLGYCNVSVVEAVSVAHAASGTYRVPLKNSPQNPSKFFFCGNVAGILWKNFVILMGLPTFYLDN